MNRRDLLKAALGLPAIKSIERLEYKPGDVFVLKVAPDVGLSMEQIQQLRETWKKTFKNAGLTEPPCMVFQNIDIAVVKGKTP